MIDPFYRDLREAAVIRVDRISIGEHVIELRESILMPPNEIRLCDGEGRVLAVIRNVGDGIPVCRHCGFTAPFSDKRWYACPWKAHDLSCPECGTTNVRGNSIQGGEKSWDE